MRTERRTRFIRRAACVVIAVLVAFAAAEAVVRFALFSDTLPCPRLENPALYTDPEIDDDYWVLYDRYPAAIYKTKPAVQDPLLGWTENNGGDLGVRSDRYFSPEDVKGRPILFFGDSFVAGTDGDTPSLPELLEDELGEDPVLNYGVGGYAVDQIALRVKRDGTRFRERGALILVGILLRDMDRCILTFRHCQKPYYTLERGQLMLHKPAYASNREFLDKYKFRTRSFVLAAIERRLRYVLRLENRAAKRRDALNRAILTDLATYLRGEQLPTVFLILYTESDLEAHAGGRPSRRELELKKILADLDVRVVDAAPILLSEAQRGGLQVSDLYDETGHLNPMANRALAIGLSASLIPMP